MIPYGVDELRIFISTMEAQLRHDNIPEDSLLWNTVYKMKDNLNHYLIGETLYIISQTEKDAFGNWGMKY